MVGRGELTDTAWATLGPLLPENGGRGQQWRDHRQVINGMLWKLRMRAPWRDLRPAGGPRPDHVGGGGEGDLGGAHRQESGLGPPARGRGPEKGGGAHPVDEALGRSRGGLTTKLHLAGDGRSRPLSVVRTPGQRHDSTHSANDSSDRR